MSVRVRKSVGLSKHMRVNLSKSEVSLSAHPGPITINSHGTESLHVAPGVTIQEKAGKPKAPAQKPREGWPDEESMSFLQSLVNPRPLSMRADRSRPVPDNALRRTGRLHRAIRVDGDNSGRNVASQQPRKIT
jgi:hypothetical protein